MSARSKIQGWSRRLMIALALSALALSLPDSAGAEDEPSEREPESFPRADAGPDDQVATLAGRRLETEAGFPFESLLTIEVTQDLRGVFRGRSKRTSTLVIWSQRLQLGP